MATVLVIADADWVMNDVRASMTLGKWEIVESAEPSRILDLVDQHRPDVVIVDMQVASMGGMAVIRAITGELEPADQPRTLLLADRSADQFLAKRAGADACVVKPFTAQALRSAIDALHLPSEVAGAGPRKSRPKK